MLSKEIWIFAEHRGHGLSPIALELLGEARKLAKLLNGKACACVLGYNIKEYFPSLGERGAERIYFSDSEEYSEYSLDSYANVLCELIAEHEPMMMIFDASSWGSELASRISWRMRLPYITEVKRIDLEKENVVISKSCYEGKVYQNATFHPEKTITMTFLPSDTDSNEHIINKAELIEIRQRSATGRVRTRCVGFLKGDPKKINLEDADLIVAGGKGTGNDISIIEDFADILGASLGGTRPIVDGGLIPFERQIGITGKSVSPRLLVALGISGAREFTAGAEKAKMTIAVNTDDKAPIFKNADLKVHGDLKEIIPALVNRLKQHRESN